MPVSPPGLWLPKLDLPRQVVRRSTVKTDVDITEVYKDLRKVEMIDSNEWSAWYFSFYYWYKVSEAFIVRRRHGLRIQDDLLFIDLIWTVIVHRWSWCQPKTWGNLDLRMEDDLSSNKLKIDTWTIINDQLLSDEDSVISFIYCWQIEKRLDLVSYTCFSIRSSDISKRQRNY